MMNAIQVLVIRISNEFGCIAAIVNTSQKLKGVDLGDS